MTTQDRVVEHLALSELELKDLVDSLLRDRAALVDDLAASYRREVQGRRRIAELNALVQRLQRGSERAA